MSKTASCRPEVLHTPDATAETVSSNSEKEAVLPDFSTLPDVVWVAVLQMLNVLDRCQLSLTCRKLYSLFSHPSTWKFGVLLVPDMDEDEDDFDCSCTMTRGKGIFFPWQEAMVEKYGRFFQNLTLCVETFELHPESYGVLQSLVKTGGLRRCVIIIYDVPSEQIFQDLSRNKGPSVYTLMEDLSSCLSGNLHLDVTSSGPGVAESMYNDAFRCSSSDLRCKHLRSLSIYSDDSWEESVQHTSVGNALQYTETPTAVLVSRLPCLQHLTLNACFFSDELLYALADMSSRRCQLRTIAGEFKICVEDWSVRDVSSKAWRQLTLSSPQLEVSCYFQNPFGLTKVFKPVAPVVNIEIEGLGEKLLSPSKFLSFCVDHCDTLESLKYSVEENIEEGDNLYPDELPVVTIAIDCPKLVRLKYGGLIHMADVIKLAKIDRRWKTFAIDKNFVLPDNQAKWPVSFTEEDTDMLEEVRQAVSQHLGYQWKFSG